MLTGVIENIGSATVKLKFSETTTGRHDSLNIDANKYIGAANYLLEWLENNIDFHLVKAIGHRIVYGMNHTAAELITPKLLNELKRNILYDPEHLPGEISLIEIFAKQYSELTQVACFDTAFHASMPQVAKLLSIPRKYQADGIRRYGFHGLSYAYLLEELERIGGKDLGNGKIIMAHLGSGASLAAVKDGNSLDTSMGFTPASGLPMSTRCGDLDPGVASFLMQVAHLTPLAFNDLINHQSGLVGLSETSGDMQELLMAADTDARAAEAVDFFCYQVKKWIGSFVAVLQGLETLVFAGGVGENASLIRMNICSGLQFLGIELDETKNKNNDLVISLAGSKVTVYVIKTDEQLMIARQVSLLLKYPDKIHPA